MPRALTPPYAYTLPADYIAVPGQPITSASHNDPLTDIQTTFNAPQPIQYGGTAGNSVITGWDGLGAAGATVPSATSITLDTVTGPWIDISGTTTIAGITLAAGKLRFARATGAFQLTASATLVVNGSTSVNYITTAGDWLAIEGYAAGEVDVWVVGFGGGLAGASVAATPNTLALRSANANLRANEFTPGFATTATAAGTTTLTVGSAQLQEFTGSTTQIIILPVVSTLTVGHSFTVLNKSSGVLTVKSSGANTIATVAPGQFGTFVCALITGTTAASWDYNTSAGVVVQVQVIAASGTYTPNANMLYCTIECQGGGGGGGGIANSSGIGGAGGGGGGTYSRRTASAAMVGASQVATVGAGGAGGAAGLNNGAAGGATSIGSLCTAPGGTGATGAGANSRSAGAGGGAVGGGDVSVVGGGGQVGVSASIAVSVSLFGAPGGNSVLGGSSFDRNGTGNQAGNSYGAGGVGGYSANSGGAGAGGAGGPGVIVITEFCSQ